MDNHSNIISPAVRLAVCIYAMHLGSTPYYCRGACVNEGEEPQLYKRYLAAEKRLLAFHALPSDVQRYLVERRVEVLLLHNVHLESDTYLGSSETRACVFLHEVVRLLPIGIDRLNGHRPVAEVAEALGLDRADLRRELHSVCGTSAKPSTTADEVPLSDEALHVIEPPEAPVEPVVPTTEAELDDPCTWVLCGADALDRRIANLGGDSSKMARCSRMCERLNESRVRRLPTATAEHVRAVQALSDDYPNFGTVIEEIAMHLRLCSVLGEPVYLPPLLLTGPPGVGKTCFAQALAGAIDAALECRSLAEATAGFLITGNSVSWNSSGPGVVASHIVANDSGRVPMILFDELDKVNVSRHNYPVDETLLGLLEPLTAKAFRDEYLDLPLDARPVIYLFTANRTEDLRPELLDRMRVVSVEAPTADQMPAIVRSVDRQMRRERPSLAAALAPLPEALLPRIARLPPRAVRKVLERGYAKAAQRMEGIDGQISLEAEDLLDAAQLQPNVSDRLH